jgi:hypothetical protein
MKRKHHTRQLTGLLPMGRLQGAFIHGYLLFSIALMGIVTAGIASMINSNQYRVDIDQRRQELITDAVLIRQVLLYCATLFPAGNNGAPPARTGLQHFPVTPPDKAVNRLICPGYPDSSQPDLHQFNIWTNLTRSGTASIVAPPTRLGMQPWRYINQTMTNGEPEIRFYVDAQDPTRADSDRLLRSLVNNRYLSALGFSTTTVQTPAGKSVTRLQSANLAAPP